MLQKPSRSRDLKIITAVLAGLMILFHAILAGSATITKSATFDEPIHLVGGLSYWRLNDYRIHAENGNLAQRIIALPDAFSSSVPPGMEKDEYFQSGSGYPVAWRFLFSHDIDFRSIIFRGRFTVVIASCFLALVVFLAARKLWGNAGGLIALCAYITNPIILANAGLMTSDLLAALFFALSTWALWACLHRLTLMRLSGLTFAAGAMALTKFSFPLFFPVAFAITAIALWRNHPWPISLPGLHNRLTSRWHRTGFTLAAFICVFLGVWLLIWAAYGFRYQATAPGLQGAGLLFSLDQMIAAQGLPGKVIGFCASMHLLPEAFLYGMSHVFKFSQGRYSLIAGQYFQSGVWWFYPASLFYKTPLALFGLALLTLAGLAQIRSKRTLARLYRASPWLALAILFMALAMLSPLNIGVRHVLPALVPGLILLGCARLAFNIKPIAANAIVTLLCLALVIQAVMAWPNYLSHFNTLAGPKDRLYTQFSDSNLDWGQDLPDLAAWANANITDYGSRSATLPGPLYLSYFGSARADAYKVPGITLQSYFPQPGESPPPLPYGPGIYAISATRLMVFPSFYGPAWSDYLDNAYTQRRDFILKFFSTQPGTPERAQVQGNLTRDQIGMALQEFETLRFCRFCAFLRQRQPLAQINNSIILYQVTREDLERYFMGPSPGNGPEIHNQLPESRVDLPVN